MGQVLGWLKPLLALSLRVGLTITGLASLLGWCGSAWLPCELASHFRVQYFWILGLGGLLLCLGKQFRWATAAGGLALCNAAVIAPLYCLPAVAPVQGTPRRALSLNVYSGNPHHEQVLGYVRSSKADFVLLLEVTDAWRHVLAELADDFPHQLVETRDDNFGIALLSRHLWQEARVVFAGSAELPSVVARFALDHDRLTLIGTHPLPPGNGALWRLRNEQLGALAEFARAQTGPVLLLGDLNVTSWSPYFGLLTAGTRLRDSRRGFGVQATWPDWFAIGRIPIDHCLVSPEIVVADRRVGGAVGSDHSPIVIDFLLATATAGDGN